MTRETISDTILTHMADVQLQESDVLEMARIGVIYGHKKSKTHPRMKPFIAGNRQEIELLDPEAVMAGLAKAGEFLGEKVKAGGLVLCVGTTAPAKSAVEAFAKKFNFPYVVNRWLGGTLTNSKVITDRLKFYENLKVREARGELQKYTKKEQRQFNELIGKLSRNFDGLANYSRLPDALFVVDAKTNLTAVREARKMHIPVVAVIDTDDDPQQIDYPVFANDHSKGSIEWVIEKITPWLKLEQPGK